ncbi:hypothetical protein D3C84_663200 [compost metagenome]
MKLELHLLQAEGTLEPWREMLHAEAERISQLIAIAIPAEMHDKPVDVLVQRLPYGVTPELGIGGSCFRRGLVTISLDPDNERFENSIATGEFGQLLAHELHHSMRYDSCGYGQTLGEALVSEGLADRFAQELTQRRAPIWSNALQSADWSAVVDQAEAALDRADYDHPAWFFGEGLLPKWAGYTLGYRLVEHYQRLAPQAQPHELIGACAMKLITAAWPHLKGDSHVARMESGSGG